VTSFTYLQTASCTCTQVYGYAPPYVDKDVWHGAYREKTCTAVRNGLPSAGQSMQRRTTCKPRSGYL
ncbi:hypothetical protein FOMPIDRAFT_1025164, partial [Fomitopsis schrenkii]